jgi:hypothetical protein
MPNHKVLPLLLINIAMHFTRINSLCNVYPKIFGEETSDVNFLDIEIHEATDVILSCGIIKDPAFFLSID